MEIIAVVSALWRRRWLVLIGIVLAGAVAVVIGPAPPTRSALAWTRVALDTPKSQLVDAAPDAANDLPWRASLLMHLLATDDVRAQIAQRGGVRPDEVGMIDPELATPRRPASLPQKAADAATTYAAYVITATIPSDALPVIALEVTGPDLEVTKRIAAAAAGTLVDQRFRTGKHTSKIPNSGGKNELEGYELEQITPVHGAIVSESELPIKAIGASLTLLVAWCSAVTLLPWLWSRLRRLRVVGLA